MLKAPAPEVLEQWCSYPSSLRLPPQQSQPRRAAVHAIGHWVKRNAW
jgi:hypothetical protein